MKSTREFSFEEHQQLAARLLAILDELDPLFDQLQRHPLAVKYALEIGIWAKRLQEELENELARSDLDEARAWDLYYPDDRPSALVRYRSHEKQPRR